MAQLFDPLQKEPRPWLDENGTYINLPDNPIQSMKSMVELVRGMCQKKGIPLGKVPVVHRRFHTDKVRCWDLRGRAFMKEIDTRSPNNPGFDSYCACLCGPDWRIATKEEVAAYDEKCKREGVEYARRKLRYTEAAVQKVAAEASLQQLVNMADVPDESLEELSDQEIAKVEEKLNKLKAKKATASTKK